MKKLFFGILAAGLIQACSTNPEKVLPKKDGKWNFTQVTTSTGLSGTDVEVTKGTAIFRDNVAAFTVNTRDYNGLFEVCSGDCYFTLNWVYDKDSKSIIVEDYKFAVTAERKKEVWTYYRNDAGDSEKIEITLTKD